MTLVQVLSAAVYGQDFATKEERDAWLAKIRAASEADHRQMLERLGIREIRQGANGMDRNAPNAVNYDETRANPYPELPNVLVMKRGEKVATAKQWPARLQEIREDFDREIYGRVPSKVPAVTWTMKSTRQDTIGDIPVITKTLVGHVDNSTFPQVAVDISLTLSIPANSAGSIPVVMELGFVFPSWFRVPEPTGPSWKQQVLAKGWACAVILPTTVQPDHGAGLKEGIIGLTNQGRDRLPEDWGALRAWAWGVSRAIDYFETDPAIDAKRIAIEGHSRFGKAAAVAMAYDQRVAIGFISSSGEGGLKLHRRNYGELVENVAAASEYHWMAGNFIKYAGPLNWNDLPIDAHMLVAMCAPRPMFISAGDKGDEWVDPRGSFLAGVYAGPVYRLLGARDLGTSEFPRIGQGLLEGELAFRQHEGGHTPGPNWPFFLKWAERYF